MHITDNRVEKIKKGVSELEVDKETEQQIIQLYNKFQNKKKEKTFILGKSWKHYYGAIVFYIIRMKSIPIQVEEIAEVFDTSKKQIFRSSKKMKKFLGLPNPQLGKETFDNLLDRTCDDLDIPDGRRKIAKQILDLVLDNNIHVGKKPSSVVMACVYISNCKEDSKENETYISQADIHNLYNVPTPTLRSVYHEIISKLSEKDEFEWKDFDILELDKKL